MNSLIELNVNGDIYLFLNNLEDIEYKKLYNFTISYLKDQKSRGLTFLVEEYIDVVHKHIKLSLSHYTIEKVISN